MNVLPINKRIQIISLLVKGYSVCMASRTAKCSFNTVSKLLIEVGTASREYQNMVMRNMSSKRIQCEEIWAFCYSKGKRMPIAQEDALGMGDVWFWTAIDADTKLVPSFMAGKRDAHYAQLFIEDLVSRFTNCLQLNLDDHKACLVAANGMKDDKIDYSLLFRHYGNHEGEMHNQKHHSSFGFVDCQNLAMPVNRFNRLTNVLDKKVRNLECMVALHIMYYNFGRIHKSLRASPAMAAGISDTLWSIEDIVELVPGPRPTKRGSYKKRNV